MKTLLILRHAKSSWKYPEVSDHDRPLNKRGRRDAPRVSAYLRTHGPTPDVIVSSTALRARSTADAVADRCGGRCRVILDRRLYLADPAEVVDVLQGHGGDARTVMVVGHNPGLADLVTLLTGQHEAFPTAALAEVRLPIATWLDLRPSTDAQLVTIWRPKDE